jgi:hypothetical protein
VHTIPANVDEFSGRLVERTFANPIPSFVAGADHGKKNYQQKLDGDGIFRSSQHMPAGVTRGSGCDQQQQQRERREENCGPTHRMKAVVNNDCPR